MNAIIQNVGGVLAASGIMVTGMLGIDSRYLDNNEAARAFQSKQIAEQQIIAQLAVNTSVAATLIDLRIRQYKYTAEHSKSQAERDAMNEQALAAQAELSKLSVTYNHAIEVVAPSHAYQGSLTLGSD